MTIATPGAPPQGVRSAQRAGTAQGQREHPAYRGFEVHVVRARRISPSFLRMTFTGADLHLFGTDGLDQRIKLVLPVACGVPVDVDLYSADDWYAAWRALPDPERNPLRTYTVRAVRPQLGEVDVDVVLHGMHPGQVTTRGCGLAELLGCVCTAGVGPAVRWCAAARPGDPLVLIGPDSRYVGPPVGIEWRPPADAHTFLLVGDETAVPAVSSILESVPVGVRAHAFLEVPTQHDVLDLAVPAGVSVTWLPRRGVDVVPSHGTLLESAVRAAVPALLGGRGAHEVPGHADGEPAPVWEVPTRPTCPDGVYAWVAGEAGVVRGLRRYLGEVGLDRRAVAAMGYWRAGRSETT